MGGGGGGGRGGRGGLRYLARSAVFVDGRQRKGSATCGAVGSGRSCQVRRLRFARALVMDAVAPSLNVDAPVEDEPRSLVNGSANCEAFGCMADR